MAKWSAAPPTPELARIERQLRCLACNGTIEKSLAALGSLRCAACRESDAPLDARLVDGEPGPHA